PWVLALSGALVAAGAALVLFGLWPKQSPVLAPQEVAVAESASPSVENAVGLTRIGAKTEVLKTGAAIASGDVLRTTHRGEAMLALPDGSRVKLHGDGQLALTRVEKDDVAL